VEKGLPFEIREVDLANKDEEFVQLYRSIAADPEAGGKVPILVDSDGTKLVESNVIVEYLEQRYPEPRLLPADAAQAAKVRLFIETFSSTFPGGLFGLMRAGDAEALEAGKAKLTAALKVGSSQRGCTVCFCLPVSSDLIDRCA
jgi:glutathione S-transferase